MSEPRWIPVGESMPEGGDAVWIFCPTPQGGWMGVGLLSPSGEWWDEQCATVHPTHWMPLPPPPPLDPGGDDPTMGPRGD